MKFARVCGHDLWVPDHVAEWDAVAGDSDWERPRIESVIDHMSTRRHGTLWDIGAEHGWMSALFAKSIGCRMMLVEPTHEFWPNIRLCFEHNELPPPIAMVEGFAGNVDDGAPIWMLGWPPAADGDESPARPYGSLGQHTRLDSIARIVGYPDGITIDVEGAELIVLWGAGRILSGARPVVWVSIHPEMLAAHGSTPDDVHRWMRDMKYQGEHLATDHEAHYVFRPT